MQYLNVKIRIVNLTNISLRTNTGTVRKIPLNLYLSPRNLHELFLYISLRKPIILPMKFGILIFPGGHGDLDLRHVLKHHFNKEPESIWYKNTGPFDIDVLLISGGFPCRESSTGFDCFKDSPALNYLGEFADQGKYIIGFGNGFQLLCEAGLLPGKLNKNLTEKYICKHVFIKPDNDEIMDHLSSERSYRVAIATYNGNFVASEQELVQMRQDQQIIFRYCDYSGRITESVNYTGSMDNIAGICNAGKNVFGMIPQPERSFVEYGGTSDGLRILELLMANI